eukprot:CAMPEP_0185583246 /NCGR_PEP_ID=MMETSP0434-20130131/21405_1 /TAXON_ID=626734 ORGANISM="Favella taraikaensis, Strain Fe Narragansett Bay" /NCGR_SAMPLE_ID=MMETSP0434 /ASSEMBLY_ACC=CAM_ASM_000379 /LENGTH=73 /DNA_ID=CAMNT_0028202269 /DNA_START=130 /DNA_END=351 /DNA_ORIENTATION=-
MEALSRLMVHRGVAQTRSHVATSTRASLIQVLLPFLDVGWPSQDHIELFHRLAQVVEAYMCGALEPAVFAALS